MFVIQNHYSLHQRYTYIYSIQNVVYYVATYIFAISVKLTNAVFFVPTRTTWGGLMTNFFFSPATISGFLSRIMPNTRCNNSS